MYVCNHSPLPPPPPPIRVNISSTSDYVELAGLGQVGAYDVLNNVWCKRGETTCDTAPLQLGSSQCFIQFDYHGSIKWTTNNGTASTLVGLVGITQGWTTQQDHCSTPGGVYCCGTQT